MGFAMMYSLVLHLRRFGFTQHWILEWGKQDGLDRPGAGVLESEESTKQFEFSVSMASARALDVINTCGALNRPCGWMPQQ